MKRAVLALVVSLPVVLAVGGSALGKQPGKRLSDFDRGKELYDRHCIQCHGETAGGDGPAAAALVVDVPELRDPAVYEDLDAGARMVLGGRGAMPAFETSFDRYDARRTLRYMREVAEGDPDPLNKEPEEPPADDETDDDVEAGE